MKDSWVFSHTLIYGYEILLDNWELQLWLDPGLCIHMCGLFRMLPICLRTWCAKVGFYSLCTLNTPAGFLVILSFYFLSFGSNNKYCPVD